MNPLTDIDPLALAGFGAAALAACAGAVLTSGYFPAEARPPALRRSFAAPLIAAGVATTVVLFAAALLTALRLPWAVAVVAGGAAILLAPFLIQPLPERWRDSRLGAGLFTLLGLAILGLALGAVPTDPLSLPFLTR